MFAPLTANFIAPKVQSWKVFAFCLSQILAPFVTYVVASCISLRLPRNKVDKCLNYSLPRCRHPLSPMLLLATSPHEYLGPRLIDASTLPCKDASSLHCQYCCFLRRNIHTQLQKGKVLPGCLAEMLAPLITNIIATYIPPSLPKFKVDKFFHPALLRCSHPLSSIFFPTTFKCNYSRQKSIFWAICSSQAAPFIVLLCRSNWGWGLCSWLSDSPECILKYDVFYIVLSGFRFCWSSPFLETTLLLHFCLILL